MSSRKNRKSVKSETDNRQHNKDLPQRQDGPVDDVSLMRQILLEQVRNKKRETMQGEAIKADADDPFETNPTLRTFMRTFLANATRIRGLEEDRSESIGAAKNPGESIPPEVNPVSARKKQEHNPNETHCAFRLARHDGYERQSEDNEAGLLKEILLAGKQSDPLSVHGHKSNGRSRKMQAANIDPLSNEALLRVMPDFLAAEKEGKIKVDETSVSVDKPQGQPTPTLKLMLATFLEKAIAFHMPHPGLHIDGVPDDYDEEQPLRFRIVPRNEVRGFGSIIYRMD